MKINILFYLLFFVLNSCIWLEPDINPSSRFEPIIMKRSDFEKSIKLLDAKTIENAGKIYVIGDLLYLNDKYKGFQVINNTNPNNPTNDKFITIPGATDVAVRNGTLYINQATDLVVLSYDNLLKKLTVVKRIKNVFPQIASPDNDYVRLKSDEIIVNWKNK